MSISLLARYSSFLFALVLALIARSCETREDKTPFSFSFHHFKKNPSFASQIALSGDAEIVDSAVRITHTAVASSGRITYRKPVGFLGKSPGFSTYFAFSISQRAGDSLAFFLLPSEPTALESTDGLRFGLASTVISVEFTSMGLNSGNQSSNFVSIYLGGELAVKSSDLSTSNLIMKSGQKLHSWIDYDGFSKKVEVRVSKSVNPRPVDALLSYPLDLSNALRKEKMLVGIHSSCGNDSTQTSMIYSWSFSVKHGAPYMMHSDPLDPHQFLARSAESRPVRQRRPHSWGVFLMLMVVTAAIGTLMMWYAVVSRRGVDPMEFPMHTMESGYERIAFFDDKGIIEC
ncbi:L-type lectin-domain containing receptor kinase VIII.1 [Typha angustifolia]|uniref:L-type lectin-domain containing receptor kinase VIII.1 n=1 Tax=Typha angustifolia TaxID=59011 RepID=UPI003C2EEECA